MGVHEQKLFLQEFVSNKQALEELLVYAQNKFEAQEVALATAINQEDYLLAWQRYAEEAAQKGVLETLQQYFPQLKFPVEEGISSSEAYKNATLKGHRVSGDSRLKIEKPKALQLKIYSSDLIGEVPVITVSEPVDFYRLVSVFVNKNEPKEFPKSMGAIFINGIYNWDRIHRLKDQWSKEAHFGETWASYFKKNILPNPYLFKDKLMILSTKEYSGISADIVGLDEREWEEISTRIRREHECVHLFTLKHYGCMNNNMHDEIIADYGGILAALGHFDKNWFLHFLGLEQYPVYRKGGRLENYQGTSKMSQEAFDGLKILVKHAADTIEKFDHVLGRITDAQDFKNRIKSLCEVDLISMALPNGSDILLDQYHRKQALTVS